MTTVDAPTVVVIDDDDAMREAIHGLLKSVGLRSETFGAAEEFLRSKRPDGPRLKFCGSWTPRVTKLL